MSKNLENYLFAAKRQVEIALHFKELLDNALEKDPVGSNETPKVETQAYFEGLICATRAAEEKLYESVCIYHSCPDKDKSQKYKFAQEKIALETGLPCWSENANELRKMRNAMAHQWHDKSPQGPCWVVEPIPGEEEPFERRPVSEYAEKAACLARLLSDAIKRYER